MNYAPITHTEARTVARQAFNMFGQQKLSEAALLAAIRVTAPYYEPDDEISKRALTAVDEGRLSEDVLLKILRSR